MVVVKASGKQLVYELINKYVDNYSTITLNKTL